MITPRVTRLVRVGGLRAFQQAIVGSLPADPDLARSCAVIVPTHGAAEQLRETLAFARAALPDLVTRDEFYDRLRERLPGTPLAMSPFHREVLLRRCAREVQQEAVEAPFAVRAGLVAEILRLYDELRRRDKTVADFDRLMVGTLEPGAGYDRGAARLLQQTRFLVALFTRFETFVAAVELFDEHRLRERLLLSESPLVTHAIVTVADQAADAYGLWTADFDLLARMPHLSRIDVIATEAILQSGFHERIHDLLPGVEEVRFETAAAPPVLVAPDGEADARVFVLRDREEELADVARIVPTAASLPERFAVVFQRPLPYLYLARQVFEDAGIEWHALDSLPLAGEPFAAVVDVLFSAIAAEFTRGVLIDLLRSPHLTFSADGTSIGPREIASLNTFLIKRKYLGGIDRLAALAEEGPPAVRAALDAARELSSALSAESASAQIDGIVRFLAARERRPQPSDPWHARHLRARAAVMAALEGLRDAHTALDAAPLAVGELAAAVRRWIEGQTFAPRHGTRGIALMDSRAAAYAALDEIRIVGLTEQDWPERSERSIFYPQSLLAQLGWPNDQDRLRAARASFQDLVRLPRSRVALSTITLEDDAIVPASPLLDDLDALGLPIERPAQGRTGAPRVFTHEALSIDPVSAGAVSGPAAAWLAQRIARDCSQPRFHGSTSARAPAVYAISRVEKYLDCPFRYFAASVLKLAEEQEEQGWLTPQERGTLMHEVFCEFFTAWHREGRGAITPANVADAVTEFRAIAEAHIAKLPESDRALERTLLLGSAAASGLAERAFAFEIDDTRGVVDRLLEYELEGSFTFAAHGEAHRIDIRSKADRIDLLDDGTLRIVDYKLGNPPKEKRALQLPIYGVCASQKLEGRHGRSWTVSDAGYIAFKGRKSFAALSDIEAALADGQEKLVDAVHAIERGAFPVQPDEPFLCSVCPYPAVCRKDYVGDE